MFVEPNDLSIKISAAGLIDTHDDDGDGVADPIEVGTTCKAADAFVRSFFIGKGRSPDQIDRLEHDPALRNIALNIAAEIAYQRRPHLMNPDGSTLYTAAARQSREDLIAYARNELRSTAEPQAGKSRNLTGHISPEPNYNFAPTLERPNGKGGF